ncbi:MAG: hypothetical protein E7436_05635 [Ruminococcaceae bacterium]|nr:hypothetical protein [Oscillospiraceae bacterium]
MHRKLRTAVLPALGMMILILDGRTAIQGASEGIRLCLQTVIPSLFPFFVLSSILTAHLTDSGGFRFLGRLFHIPAGAESIFAVGLLGGYPVGARLIAEACRRGDLHRRDGDRMLMFCSNAGPAFIFGLVGPQFSDPLAPWLLWGIHILSAVLVAVFVPASTISPARRAPGGTITLTAALNGAVRTMGTVCGWILLFRVIIAFLERWFGWLLPAEYLIPLEGILELSNGCCGLSAIANDHVRFMAASGLLAFGGVCVGMQTSSVAGELNITNYWKGKALQTLFSLLLASFQPIIMVIPVGIALFLKIRGRNPVKTGV